MVVKQVTIKQHSIYVENSSEANKKKVRYVSIPLCLRSINITGRVNPQLMHFDGGSYAAYYHFCSYHGEYQPHEPADHLDNVFPQNF